MNEGIRPQPEQSDSDKPLDNGTFDDAAIVEALLTNSDQRPQMIINQPEKFFKLARRLRYRQVVAEMAMERTMADERAKNESAFWPGLFKRIFGR